MRSSSRHLIRIASTLHWACPMSRLRELSNSMCVWEATSHAARRSSRARVSSLIERQAPRREGVAARTRLRAARTQAPPRSSGRSARPTAPSLRSRGRQRRWARKGSLDAADAGVEVAHARRDASPRVGQAHTPRVMQVQRREVYRHNVAQRVQPAAHLGRRCGVGVDAAVNLIGRSCRRTSEPRKPRVTRTVRQVLIHRSLGRTASEGQVLAHGSLRLRAVASAATTQVAGLGGRDAQIEVLQDTASARRRL